MLLSQENYKLAAARLQGEVESMQWVERSTSIRADWEVGCNTKGCNKKNSTGEKENACER